MVNTSKTFSSEGLGYALQLSAAEFRDHVRTRTDISLLRLLHDLQREVVDSLILQLHYALHVRDLLLQRRDLVILLLQLLLQANEYVPGHGFVRHLVGVQHRLHRFCRRA